MSGTSVDGVDVAVVRVVGRGWRMRAELLGQVSVGFSPGLREAIFQMRGDGRVSLADLAEMGRELTLAYANAARRAMAKCGIAPADVACIAAHGQTLFHAPPLTIQWFDPALLAALTGCAVVSDFRRADCAAGGQGAPLVPYADWMLFRDAKVNRVLLNIGGIANVTYLPAGRGSGTGSGTGAPAMIAFDTGPGNCLSDQIARENATLPHGRGFDLGGRIAATGTPAAAVVDGFLSDPYFASPPPKSTDGPEMWRIFAQSRGRRRLALNDQFATACLCCARTVAMGIRRQLPGQVGQIIAAGGGVRNKTIMRFLAGELGLPIHTTAKFGIPIEAREAMAFALLAAATLDGEPSNVPSVTGAGRAVILGSVTPRQR